MTEKEVEQHLCKRVKALGGYAYKFRSVTQVGVADRIVCLAGQTWFVEVKQPSGRLSALQRIFAEEMEKTQQRYVCLWSKSEVDEWLHSITRSTPTPPSGCAT
jgi:Holliday junction resolvase-like predicted endonuclease